MGPFQGNFGFYERRVSQEGKQGIVGMCRVDFVISSGWRGVDGSRWMDWGALCFRGSSEDGASGGDAVPTLPRGSRISWDLGNSKGAGGRVLG